MNINSDITITTTITIKHYSNNTTNYHNNNKYAQHHHRHHEKPSGNNTITPHSSSAHQTPSSSSPLSLRIWTTSILVHFSLFLAVILIALVSMMSLNQSTNNTLITRLIEKVSGDSSLLMQATHNKYRH